MQYVYTYINTHVYSVRMSGKFAKALPEPKTHEYVRVHIRIDVIWVYIYKHAHTFRENVWWVWKRLARAQNLCMYHVCIYVNTHTHIPCECLVSLKTPRQNQNLDMDESCRTYEWVTPHIWVSHVAHTNYSCRTYEWFMSHIWMSHVTYMNESCRTYEWVMSHIWMSHVTRMNESCRTYEWFISHIWMSHVIHMNESCHTYESCACAFIRVVNWIKSITWHAPFESNYSKVMSHLNQRTSVFIRVTWMEFMMQHASFKSHVTFESRDICVHSCDGNWVHNVTWLIQKWHDTFKCVMTCR